jgi:hypothetical protein
MAASPHPYGDGKSEGAAATDAALQNGWQANDFFVEHSILASGPAIFMVMNARAESPVEPVNVQTARPLRLV